MQKISIPPLLLKRLSEQLSAFFRWHPALVYGLSVLAACYASLEQSVFTFCLWGVVALLASRGQSRRLWGLGAILFLATFGWVYANYQLPDIQGGSLEGRGYLSISDMSERQGHHGTYLAYRGKLHAFYSDSGLVARQIPVSLSLPLGAPPLASEQNYLVHGRLSSATPPFYILKLSQGEPPSPIGTSYSLAQWRLSCKSYLRALIKERYLDPSVAALFFGLLTGEIDDVMLTMDFARLGIQHVLAISGFHFAILGSLLHLLLRRFLSPRILAATLIVFLSTYYVIIGPGPSVQRAWVFSLLILVGLLLGRRPEPCNTLGVALLVVLFWDPLACLRMGFYYSFVATGAILLLFPLVDRWLKRAVSSYPLSQVVEMGMGDQHVLLFMGFVRQALAITLSVHLALWPLLLTHSHYVSVLGVLSNLFFPFLISFHMLLFLLACVLDVMLPSLAVMIHQLNGALLQGLLEWMGNWPLFLDFRFRCDGVSPWMGACYLCLLGMISIFCIQRDREFLEQHQRWQFL